MFYFCAIKLIVTYGCKVNTMFRHMTNCNDSLFIDDGCGGLYLIKFKHYERSKDS